jgi:hypothetical protein
MANNRLYVYDTQTDEYCLLAKTFGSGWIIQEGLQESLGKWLEGRDLCSCGFANKNQTSLVLVAVNPHIDLDAEIKKFIEQANR